MSLGNDKRKRVKAIGKRLNHYLVPFLVYYQHLCDLIPRKFSLHGSYISWRESLVLQRQLFLLIPFYEGTIKETQTCMHGERRRK